MTWIFFKKYVVMKRGRLKILLFKFAIFDLNLAVFVFLLFKGCVQFVRVCFLKVATFASSPSVILQRMSISSFLNWRNLPICSPRNWELAWLWSMRPSSTIFLFRGFCHVLGDFQELWQTFITSLLITAWHNFFVSPFCKFHLLQLVLIKYPISSNKRQRSIY